MPDLFFELEAKKKGHVLIAGIDEAGRGPLAGPVSAAAVILPSDYTHEILTDSKKLTEKKREAIFEELIGDDSILTSHVFITAEEIDKVNILKATHLAMADAVAGLPELPDYCLIDGLPVPNFPYPSEGIVKGDSKSLSISAASVIAKVMRDRYMVDIAKKYPEYGFERHKGYGTKLHLEVLERHGPCPLHRRSFAPVSQSLLKF